VLHSTQHTYRILYHFTETIQDELMCVFSNFDNFECVVSTDFQFNSWLFQKHFNIINCSSLLCTVTMNKLVQAWPVQILQIAAHYIPQINPGQCITQIHYRSLVLEAINSCLPDNNNFSPDCPWHFFFWVCWTQFFFSLGVLDTNFFFLCVLDTIFFSLGVPDTIFFFPACAPHKFFSSRNLPAPPINQMVDP
jgi:hypothetical protein